jgi:hypothetical protein
MGLPARSRDAHYYHAAPGAHVDPLGFKKRERRIDYVINRLAQAPSKFMDTRQGIWPIGAMRVIRGFVNPDEHDAARRVSKGDDLLGYLVARVVAKSLSCMPAVALPAARGKIGFQFKL